VFTGIVRGAFAVVERRDCAAALRLGVQLDAETCGGLELGASVAVSGVCLTVVDIDDSRVAAFDIVSETSSKTRLAALRVGDRVNIERSLRVGDELGGHTVSGHVMGTATVHSVKAEGWQHQVWLQVPAEWMRYILHKGFIAVDGCSLTVGEVSAAGFCVNLIPETLRRTTLGELEPGAHVNIELDPMTVAIVATVERVLAARGLATEHG
jgi:riboflavin synthase